MMNIIKLLKLVNYDIESMKIHNMTLKKLEVSNSHRT